MTAKLLTTHKQRIKDLTLTPAGGGAFEVKFDDELVWSKLKTKEFPNEDAIVALAGKRLA